MVLNIKYILEIVPKIASYLPVTIFMAVFAMVLAIFLGVLLTIVFYIPKLQWITRTYTLIFRGFPTLVLLFIAYYGVPQLLHTEDDVSAFAVATFCLAFKEAAYLEEIFRSGILSIDKGQMEAGRSLGLSKAKVYRKIIVPQTFRYIVPPTGNTFIGLIKETSLAFSIGVTEIFGQGKLIASENFQYFNVYIVVGILYVILIYFYSLLQTLMEKKLNQIYE